MLSQAILQRLVKRIHDSFGLRPRVAGEIEFYLESDGGDSASDNKLLALLLIAAQRDGVVLHGVHNETGLRQYEVALGPRDDVFAAINDIIWVKNNVVKLAEQLNIKAIFEAKPYMDQPGCGLHFHVNLYDDVGRNVFCAHGDNNESDELRHVVGGLCAIMLESMVFFAPNERSYLRYNAEQNPIDEEHPMRAHNQAPVNVSWGSNNRTTAIRIPTSTIDPMRRHIEHRVPGADADPLDCMVGILAGIYIGLRDVIEPGEKIWGNAFDKQYKLCPLPSSLIEANELFEKGFYIKGLLGDL